MKVLFLVIRPSLVGYGCAAIVTAETEKGEKREFFNALKKAVTSWVRDSVRGREQWDETMGDLNIGDLGMLGPDDYDDLSSFLNLEGITNFDVNILSAPTDGFEWNYDTLLAGDFEEEAT